MPAITDNTYNSVSGGALVGLLHRAVKSIARKNRCQGRLQYSKAHALAIISDKRQINQRELLGMLDIRPSTLSEVLAELEEAGMVSRERSPRDKRNYLVKLSRAGEALVNEYASLRDEMARVVFSGFSESEMHALWLLLSKLVNQLDDMQKRTGSADVKMPALYFGREGYVPDSK